MKRCVASGRLITLSHDHKCTETELSSENTARIATADGHSDMRERGRSREAFSTAANWEVLWCYMVSALVAVTIGESGVGSLGITKNVENGLGLSQVTLLYFVQNMSCGLRENIQFKLLAQPLSW